MKFEPDKSDFFLSIDSQSIFEQKIKGSGFIGHSYPIESKENAVDILESIRKSRYDATHNCFAFCLGKNNDIVKYSDDGEPQGTAGKQILQAINHFDYKNILVIITRYYGGTKLGVGPLARAYYDTAKESLNLAIKKIIFLTISYKIFSDYNSVSNLKHLFEDFSLHTTENYSDNVVFFCEILKSQSIIFEKALIEKTNGKIKFEIINENSIYSKRNS